VYSLARKSSATCIEEFSEELIDYLLSHNPQVSSAEVSIHEKILATPEGRRKASPTPSFKQQARCKLLASLESAGKTCT